MLISLIVPIHNEEAGLERFWQAVKDAISKCNHDFEIVMVDDGSRDNSWRVITEFTSEHHKSISLSAIRFSRKFGKEAAILAGLRQVSGSAAIVIDADLQHPPSLIPDMLDLWDKDNVPIVEGVKIKRQQESFAKRLIANLYHRSFKLSSGLDIRGATDFKLLDRSVIDHYISLPESDRFFRGLTAWMGFNCAAIEFEPPNRETGESAWSLGELIDLARLTIIGFSSLPLRIVTWFGLLGLTFSFFLTIQTLWYKWFGFAEEGFPTVILLILGMGSMILFGLGLIGEYVAKIYHEIKKRPAYIITNTASSHPVNNHAGQNQVENTTPTTANETMQS